MLEGTSHRGTKKAQNSGLENVNECSLIKHSLKHIFSFKKIMCCLDIVRLIA